MKKPLLYSISIFLFCGLSFASAQNLVPDPGFEDTALVYCGIYITTDFNAALHYWRTPTNGTPDLFTNEVSQSCWNYRPNSTYAGPVCNLGYQVPHGGNNFAGAGVYTIPGFNQREYIQSPLTSPMIPGVVYQVDWYASLPNNRQLYTNRLGAFFSRYPISSSTDQPLLVTPQVSVSAYISDTMNWVHVSGLMLADSAYTYITIGNFYNDDSTTTVTNPGGNSGPGCYGSYYYIDDVSVVPTKLNVAGMTNTFSLAVIPNPFHVTTALILPPSLTEGKLKVHNMLGAVLKEQTISGHSVIINREGLENGIYFIRVISDEGEWSGKVIVE